MNFAALKAIVLSDVIDTPAVVQANVGLYINRAIKQAEQKYNFKYMEKNQEFITTAGSLSLGTISSFKEYRDRGPYLLKQFAPASRLYVAGGGGQELQTFTSNSAWPDQPHFIRFTQAGTDFTATFTVDPYPDQTSDWNDGNWKIEIPYYGYSNLLTADADTNWLTINAEEYVEYQAAAFAFLADWNYDAMAIFKQMADEKYKQVVKADKMQRVSGVDTLVINFEGANQGMVQK